MVLPQRLAPSVSTIGLTLSVPTSTVEALLAEYVADTVAEDRNVSAGVAGKVSYVIKRGKPKLETRATGVRATVELTGEIHVCKPFGGACFEYGVCHPEWTAVVDVRSPWQLDREPDVDLDVEVTRGCVLSPVKFDATAELEKITRAEVRKIEKRLDREVHAFHSALRKRLGKVERLRLTKDSCVAIGLDSVAVDIERETKHYALGVESKGSVTLDCNDPTASLTEKTRIVTQPKLSPATDVRVASRVSMSAITQEWQGRLPHHQVRVTPSPDALLVEVAGWQGCAAGWALLRLGLVQGHIELTPVGGSDPNLTALLTAPRALDEAALAHTRSVAELERQLHAPLHVESELIRERFTVQLAPALTTDAGLRLEPDAVVFQTTLRGTLTGNVVMDR